MIRLISLAIERQHEGLSWHAVQDVEIYIGVDDSRQGRDEFVYISCIPYTTVYLPYTSVNDIIHILATCLDASIVPTVTTVNFSRVWPPLPAASSL